MKAQRAPLHLRHIPYSCKQMWYAEQQVLPILHVLPDLTSARGAAAAATVSGPLSGSAAWTLTCAPSSPSSCASQRICDTCQQQAYAQAATFNHAPRAVATGQLGGGLRTCRASASACGPCRGRGVCRGRHHGRPLVQDAAYACWPPSRVQSLVFFKRNQCCAKEVSETVEEPLCEPRQALVQARALQRSASSSAK